MIVGMGPKMDAVDVKFYQIVVIGLHYTRSLSLPIVEDTDHLVHRNCPVTRGTIHGLHKGDAVKVGGTGMNCGKIHGGNPFR